MRYTIDDGKTYKLMLAKRTSNNISLALTLDDINYMRMILLSCNNRIVMLNADNESLTKDETDSRYLNQNMLIASNDSDGYSIYLSSFNNKLCFIIPGHVFFPLDIPEINAIIYAIGCITNDEIK